MKFEIYSGLKGKFGGANYLGLYEFNSLEDALRFAYKESRDLFEAYNGLEGIQTIRQIIKGLGVNKETAEGLWLQQKNDYLDYSVVEFSN